MRRQLNIVRVIMIETDIWSA